MQERFIFRDKPSNQRDKFIRIGFACFGAALLSLWLNYASANPNTFGSQANSYQSPGANSQSANQAPARHDQGAFPVKKSSNGICHRYGDSFYFKTVKFTPYQSMEDCMKSGGRPAIR